MTEDNIVKFNLRDEIESITISRVFDFEPLFLGGALKLLSGQDIDPTEDLLNDEYMKENTKRFIKIVFKNGLKYLGELKSFEEIKE
jgi:hypothetical protein